MDKKNSIEVFTAGCPVCDEAVKELRNVMQNNCEILVYDLNKGCETNECRHKAKKYGVKSVPAVAINGQLANCCTGGGIDVDAIKTACGV